MALTAVTLAMAQPATLPQAAAEQKKLYTAPETKTSQKKRRRKERRIR